MWFRERRVVRIFAVCGFECLFIAGAVGLVLTAIEILAKSPVGTIQMTGGFSLAAMIIAFAGRFVTKDQV